MEAKNASSANSSDGDAARQPSQVGHQPAMGYPPGDYGQQYAGYPAGNNYPQASYYVNQQTYSSGAGSFFRGFLLCSCLLFVGLALMILLSMLSHPIEVPKFMVESLSVSNFDTNNRILTADWDAKISIQNPNKLKSSFTNFQMQVYYKKDQVGLSYGSGFELGEDENRLVNVRASSSSSNPVFVEKSKLEEMGKDQGSGSVTVNLNILTLITFRKSYSNTKMAQIEAKCEDLKVEFQNGSNNGSWNSGGKSVDCQFY